MGLPFTSMIVGAGFFDQGMEYDTILMMLVLRTLYNIHNPLP